MPIAAPAVIVNERAVDVALTVVDRAGRDRHRRCCPPRRRRPPARGGRSAPRTSGVRRSGSGPSRRWRTDGRAVRSTSTRASGKPTWTATLLGGAGCGRASMRVAAPDREGRRRQPGGKDADAVIDQPVAAARRVDRRLPGRQVVAAVVDLSRRNAVPRSLSTVTQGSGRPARWAVRERPVERQVAAARRSTS